MPNTIQVYEYSWLNVGDKFGIGKTVEFKNEHYLLLAKYLDEHSECNFFKIYLNRIRFANYVGVIKVGDLTIEVLPKTDRDDLGSNSWQQILLQMLEISINVKAKVTTFADIRIRKQNVLDAYFELFLKETENLLHHGLVKKYRDQVGDQKFLKGRLIINKQLSKNLIQAQRFFVSSTIYDRDNLYNGILYKTLSCISGLKHSLEITQLSNKLLLDFPECQDVVTNEFLFRKIKYDRKTARYRRAIELAKIILLNYHPDIKGGCNNLLAIMFDMNYLWENYIFHIIQKASTEKNLECMAFAQSSAAFWRHPDKWTLHLVPDIVIQKRDGQIFILDTKWKYDSGTSPEDIRQLFAYGQYFAAKNRYLLYPTNAHTKVEKNDGPFYEPSGKLSLEETCGLIFIDPITEDGKLNLEVGKEILSSLFG